MKSLNALFVILLLCTVSSCRTETIQCETTGDQVYFVGFSFDEVSTVRLYVYEKDNLFDSLVDSMTMNEGMSASDTVVMPELLNDNHDYRIKLLGSNTVYAITGLTPGNHYSEKIKTGLVDDLVKYGCVNNTVSYTLNGQQYGQPTVMSGVYNIVYINK